jgi:opacity protein-like surface antigen
MMKHILSAATLFAALATSSAAFSQVVVVVGNQSPQQAMTREQARAFYLGQAFQLANGNNAALLDLPESAQQRQDFYTKVASKNQSQVRAIWSRLAFSGKGQPPREVLSGEEVKKILAANPDAIAYLHKSEVDNRVKVILQVD